MVNALGAPDNAVAWGVTLIVLAGLTATALVVVPSRRIDVRQRLHTRVAPGSLSRTATKTTGLITRAVGRGGRADRWAHALDRAGIRRPLPEFLLIMGAGALLAAAVGALLGGGLILGILFALCVLIGTLLVVNFKADRRKRQFADHLDDLSQLLATNLRSGHSLLQALSSLAAESEEPVRSEIARAVNQVRVGRDVGDALSETAARMDSDDFGWIAQAISIHRQVGGNLAEVLDTVGETVRERAQVRRQVRALSAEGRFSALILMALPVFVGGILVFMNPVYMTVFTQSTIGWIMLLACLVMMTIGGLWLRKLIQVDF